MVTLKPLKKERVALKTATLPGPWRWCHRVLSYDLVAFAAFSEQCFTFAALETAHAWRVSVRACVFALVTMRLRKSSPWSTWVRGGEEKMQGRPQVLTFIFVILSTCTPLIRTGLAIRQNLVLYSYKENLEQLYS